MTIRKLPYGKQSIDQSDIQAVVDILKSEWLTQGPAVQNFEEKLKKMSGADYALACNSGTAALYIAYRALDIGPGDIVIVPAITFAATANAARLTGADVAFCDVDPHTGLLALEKLDDLVGSFSLEKRAAIRAITTVHMAGQTCDMETLAQKANELDAFVIEDACHAIGSRYTDKQGRLFAVGSCAHSSISTFSFHPVKTIAMGEGGALTTNSKALSEICRKLVTHGITKNPEQFVHHPDAFVSQDNASLWYYEMQYLSGNFRLSDLHCALGSSQLSRLDKFREQRLKLWLHYKKRLSEAGDNIKGLQAERPEIVCWHLFVVLIDFEAFNTTRSKLVHKLLKSGISTQVHYIPVNEHPYYLNLYGQQILTGARDYYRKCLTLPLFFDMTIDDVDYVVDILLDTLNTNS